MSSATAAAPREITLSAKMLQEAKDVFHKYDADSSGAIDKKELPMLLRELNLRLSADMYSQYCDKFMRDADLDHNSTISLDEFILMFDSVFAPNRLYGAQLRASAGRGEADVVTDLVSRGCNPNAGDGRGWTPCHCAAAYGATPCILAMQKLYGPDLDVDAEDVVGWTPLFNAASNGHVDTVVHLLNTGADITAVDAQGRTALHEASSSGFRDVVAVLVSKRAALDVADRAGWTPLFCAAVHQHVDVMRVLIEAGADQSIVDVLGYTMRRYCEQGTEKVIDTIVSTRKGRPSSPRSPRS